MFKNITPGKYGKFLPIIQTLIDILLVNGVFFPLAYIMKESPITDHLSMSAFLLEVVLGCFGFFLFIVHRNRLRRSEKLVKLSLYNSLMITVSYAASLMFFSSISPQLLFFALFFISTFIILSLAWITELELLKRARRIGRNRSNVVIYGTGTASRSLTEFLNNDDSFGVNIVGYFDENCRESFTGNFLGNLEAMRTYCLNNNIHQIYYADDISDANIINQIISISDNAMCELYMIPMIGKRLQHKFFMLSINDVIPAIGVHPTPLRGTLSKFGKRAFDIIFSGIFLIFSPIIFVPVAIAIKLSSPGPVFFKQKRTGYMGNDFNCYKFRTMKVNKDSDKVQATKDDDRKTRLGNFLRHTSIDELPQFWNVFIGDMSVVGPRPHMLIHTETYRQLISQYMVRHLVKPGITGWAQVQGYRGATNELWQMEKRVDNDVWYIEHWSFLLDLKIIVKTVSNAIKGEENAY